MRFTGRLTLLGVWFTGPFRDALAPRNTTFSSEQPGMKEYFSFLFRSSAHFQALNMRDLSGKMISIFDFFITLMRLVLIVADALRGWDGHMLNC